MTAVPSENMRFFPALLCLSLGGCLFACRYDGSGTKMQWAPDMADSPANKAQRSYIDPPEGSVSMSAVFYPKSAEDAEKQLTVPDYIAQDPHVLDKGKVMFETFCLPCHGANAKGGSLPGIVPPDLTQSAYATKGDGFFFYRITFGTAIMPSYGHATSVFERWQIVKYLRTLQKGA